MKSCKIILFTAIAWAFLGSITHAQDQVAPSQGGAQLSALELSQRTQKLFPPELAADVQAALQAELQMELGGPARESFATLFLADLFYSRLNSGHFEGVPTVTWNGFDPENDRPMFVFNGTDFAYVTSNGRRIAPGKMDTDGGSIPKVLHAVGNFTPWNYGPAFIVHDWLFVAHKCNAAPDNDIDFEMSARIMAEALKTLMEVGFTNVDGQVQKFPKAEDTLYLMYLAVKTPFAKRLWDDTDSVRCR